MAKTNTTNTNKTDFQPPRDYKNTICIIPIFSILAGAGVMYGGVFQGSCRLFYAASSFCLSIRSGFRATISICIQLRVFPDQRDGFLAFA